jgi:RNA polymerase sigma factor (sigma-70 family)
MDEGLAARRAGVRAFQQQSDDAEPGARGDPERSDALRSWLAKGIHTFAVDPRRRLGGHGRARQVLAGDRRPAGLGSSEPWQSIASALSRDTVHGGMAELSAEERRVITLAYLEGRTNREIAATLGVSVSTARRRQWSALRRLDRYISRTGTWISTILLVGVGYAVERGTKLARSANVVGSADWTHKLASTIAVGAVTVVAIGLTEISPDSTGPHRSLPPGSIQWIPAPTNTSLAVIPGRVSRLGPAQEDKIVVVVDPLQEFDPSVKLSAPVPAAAVQLDADSPQKGRGCDGNPTSAPPPVPVGSPTRHPNGAPVTHPTAGGCRG